MKNESIENSLPELARLLEERLAVVGLLAESLEAGRWALGRKDAEAIARGAAHQAELCRQWRRLEDALRARARRREMQPVWACGGTCETRCSAPCDAGRSAELKAQWEALAARLRYLARVHRSLLRHMQRSLAIWDRVFASCAPTYAAPAAGAIAEALPRTIAGAAQNLRPEAPQLEPARVTGD